MSNPFVYTPAEYRQLRDLNILKHYTDNCALYLHKQTGRPIDECHAFVTRRVDPSNPQGLRDPETLVLTRERNGDRKKEVVSFSDFLSDVIQNDRILAPTMAVYHKPEDKPSILSEYIDVNIKRRNVSKGEMFAAKAADDKALAEFKNNEQKSFKISNNSLSGAHASTGTILLNKSSHSTLTSTCRTATSYGNANNEKFLFGNRHYWSPDIVKANILTIITHTDLDKLEIVLAQFGIRHPSAEETLAVIEYSTNLYWHSEASMTSIRSLVMSLTPIERSAFTYIGDLHHLAKYNDAFVRQFIERLSTKATVPHEDPDTVISNVDGDLKAFASLLCAKELAGDGISDLKKKDAHGYGILAATAQNIIDTLETHRDLIETLWRSRILPASVAHIRSSIRRGVITSDTDSTIFTVQDWTRWAVGRLDFSEKSNAVSYAFVYLATQTITHILAMVSAGIGVREKFIHKLSMKNEFAFPVFVLTSRAKHYFAYISAQEGNIFKEFDTEVKGVALKDSNAPPHVMAAFNDSLKWVMDQVIENQSVPINALLEKVANLEHDVYDSIRSGKGEYLVTGTIKDASSYKKPEAGVYSHYLFWEATFAHKYGAAPVPPYDTVKVSVQLHNQTLLKEWLNKITDRTLADSIETWLKENKKMALTTLILPSAVVEVSGIPTEILLVMDMRKLVYQTVRPFYLLLESLGLYYINDNLTQLVSDRIPRHKSLPH